MKRKNIFSNSVEDLDYMSSFNRAAKKTTTRGSRIFVWSISALVLGTIVWMHLAEIDEITKGEGKVIPSMHLQVVQNLEGGIVKELMVREGDSVKKGDILLQLSDIKAVSDFKENHLQYKSLKAKLYRLEAESNAQDFVVDASKKEEVSEFFAHELSIFLSNKTQLVNKIKILNEQLNQKINEYDSAKSKMELLEENKNLILKEEQISKELLGRGVEAKVDFLKLQRERNEIERQIDDVKNSIPRTRFAINELKGKMQQEKIDYQTKAKQEFSEAVAEIERLKAGALPLQDQVTRTKLEAPVNGIVKQLFVNTVGGVIRPGMDILEIVPSDASLLVETKIKPSDIAFIHQGQKAIVKFSAYDFSIYGGMTGEVYQISSDTIVDQQKQESYYIVKVRINQHDDINQRLSNVDIIPGMTAAVDIITGRKTILQYLLKPIIKAKQNALTEK
ncbi:MAG: HlyD family type I secretion periplasmic adaptor subunit [Sulfurimonas sp.]|uniref:HlyD family type I secretion periplasmic adaptor subunit n=1 Tax=Sulfurimonas sp. TaxID=2022749 RepID=UPI00260B3A9F|nr:HlyD family type I secretion periplasmic adaptor subunit [Sulfurimonas sp.]MDD2651506.1 HlyD family type I secretion periplasmic adaptor subunit [Sulfurimonas sp.]MDD3451047.1 HlyD family type I secretion periplasmic adaptor subunit [Sulfurimonas sp.]